MAPTQNDHQMDTIVGGVLPYSSKEHISGIVAMQQSN